MPAGVDAIENSYFFFSFCFYFIFVLFLFSLITAKKKDTITCALHLCRVHFLLDSPWCHLYGGNWICISFSLAIRSQNSHVGVVKRLECRLEMYLRGCCYMNWRLTTWYTMKANLKSPKSLRGFLYALFRERIWIVHMSRVGLCGAWMSRVKSQRAKRWSPLRTVEVLLLTSTNLRFPP